MSDYKSEFNVENYLSNLSYINKDFNSLWNEILETVPKLTDKWMPSEANESDPLLVLLKELAIFADKNNYNIDKNILERFPATLTQLRSAYNVYDDLGYTPDWYISATTPITITFNNTGSTDKTNKTDSTDKTKNSPVGGNNLPLRFKMVSDDKSSIVYTLLQDFVVNAGSTTTHQIFAMEGKVNDLTVNGRSQLTSLNLDSQNKIYFTQTNIAQNGILISTYADFSDVSYDEKQNILTGTWKRVDNLNQWPSGSYVYKLGVNSVTGSVYIQFPEDIGRLIGDGIYIKYLLSSGEQGNMGKGTISKFLNTFNSLGGYTVSDESFTLFNSQVVQNGRNPLDIEDMRKQFNKVVGVFDTLVTLRDYENYLYEHQNNLGKYVVSNIRVSDRFHDLTDSITYKHLNILGEIEDVTETLKGDNGKDLMTPYNLKFYPLYPYSYSGDKEDFNRCFETNVEARNSLLDDCKAAVEEVKCISHDIMESSGTPIFIPYDLEGQIFLQNQVSAVEAADILKKVNTQLYARLNPRELEWGKMLNYGDVVETIKSADSRIQYVALNAIHYEDPTFTITPKVEIRNIEAGNKAFTSYKDFAYYYNQSNFNYYPADATNKISSIETLVDLSSQTNGNKYIVGPNETFNILVPDYVTKTTYSNYLYVEATNAENESVTLTFAANTVLSLPENTYLKFYETKSSTNAIATIANPAILRCNKSLTLGNPPRVNMGTSYVIEVLGENKGKIRSTEAINTGSDTDQIVYVCTNSTALSDKLGETGEQSYTLLPGEYLFYTDTYGLELGVFGEGTTLTSNINKKIYVSEILPESTQNYTDWTVISSGDIEYSVNNIYSFGEGYILESTALLNDYQNKSIYFNINKSDSSINLTYQYGENETKNTLALPTGSQGLLRLALATSPDTSQSLYANQVVHLTCTSTATPPVTTVTDIKGTKDGVNVQSSKYLAYAGGVLHLNKNTDAQDIQFITYEGGSNAPTDDSLVEISTIKVSEKVIVPGAAKIDTGNNYVGEYAIFPVTLDTGDVTSDVVQYVVSKAGQNAVTMKFNTKEVGIGKIGLPRVVDNKATYVGSSSTSSNISDLIALGKDYALINPATIGYSDQYNFTYIPEESDLITKPTSASSYFLTQHVCNKYVLPKLGSTKNLTISSMSIKNKFNVN